MIVTTILLASVLASENWTVLFDGKTTNGWLEVTGKPFPTHSWRIEDGCLRAFDPGNGFEDIRTALEYDADFEFQFESKIGPNGNSGVKYLVQRTDDWTNAKGRQVRARGLEYQLSDDIDPKLDPRKRVASLYDAIPSHDAATKPVGEFNLSLIKVHGKHVEHWLNGVKVVDFETTSPEVQDILRKAAKGESTKQRAYISLQNHGTPVWFRNVQIRSGR